MGVGTTLSALVTAIDTLSGNTTPANASTATGGIITLKTGTASDLVVTGTAGVLTALDLSAGAANTGYSYRWRPDGWGSGRHHQAQRRRRHGCFAGERLRGR